LRKRYTLGMKEGRCIGLIGGLGVGAAVYYYTKLAEAHDRQNISLDLVMAHAETSAIYRFASAGDHAGMAAYLLGFVQRLAASGADLAVLPAVTPLSCAHQLASISPLPLLTIAEPVAEALSARCIRRVVLFGTRYVMESDFYGMIPGIQFAHPHSSELEMIHSTYVEIADTHRTTVDQHTRLTLLAQTLLSREHADAVILAGTDLTLLFNESNTAFPVIDCAALHIDAIVSAALEGAVSQ
jgi:aspartate racemase